MSKKLKTNKRTSEWTRKEDENLLNAYQSFQGNWEKISDLVGTDKDAKDCKNRLKLIQNNSDSATLQ